MERTIIALGTIIPRGLSRSQSATYIGVSPSLFDQMVADGREHSEMNRLSPDADDPV